MTDFQRVFDALRQSSLRPCTPNLKDDELLWDWISIKNSPPQAQQCLMVSMLARHNRVDILSPLVTQWQELSCAQLRRTWSNTLGRALVVAALSNHTQSAALLLPCAADAVDRALETAVTYRCYEVLALLVPSASELALSRAIEQCCMNGQLQMLQCVLPGHQAAACHQMIALLHGHGPMAQYLKQFVTFDQLRQEAKYILLSRAGQQLCRDVYGRG